ncbi:MAG: hypothetical protein AAFU85_08060 [Planctomycetota bacterium]
MAAARKPEQPSPILMLAPIGIVLLGYHYLFHSQLSSDVAERQRQETVLQQRTQNIQREQSSLLSQLNDAQTELAEVIGDTETVAVELAKAEAEMAKLRSFLQGENAVGLALGADVEEKQPSQPSLFGQVVSLLTTTNFVGTRDQTPPDATGGGQCHHMNLLCSILDEHKIRRIENSIPTSAGSTGLVASERKELETLLDITLPEVSRFELQLEGSYLNLNAALHEITERLPAVSVLAVSLEPGDMQTPLRFWKLELGIRG